MTEAIRAPKTTAQVDALKRIISGESKPPPAAELVGVVFKHIELGRSVFELEASGRHANPMGTLHGGILCDLADFAMGTAFASTLEEGESFTTIDLTTKFFKPIWNAKLRATAQVVKRTRQLGLVECEVVDEKGSLVAKVFSSCMALRGEEAKGR